MRTSLDVLRSLKAYVSTALGDAWEIRLSQEQGMFERPFARVAQSGPANYPNGSRFVADITQGFTVFAYAPRAFRADYALAQAQSIEDQLFRAFRVGTGYGRAMRVPLLNYDAAPISSGDAPDLSGTWHPPDYVRVTSLSTQPYVDPDDNKLWSVVANLTLNWRRTAEPSAVGPWLDDVHLREGIWGVFECGPQQPAPHEPVAFDATLSFSASGPLQFRWDFNDGTQSAIGPTTQHTFTDPGVYNVTLIVTDPLGETQTFQRVITVS